MPSLRRVENKSRRKRTIRTEDRKGKWITRKKEQKQKWKSGGWNEKRRKQQVEKEKREK